MNISNVLRLHKNKNENFATRIYEFEELYKQLNNLNRHFPIRLNSTTFIYYCDDTNESKNKQNKKINEVTRKDDIFQE